MDAAVDAGVFPGGVLHVQRGEQVIHASAHGLTRLAPPGEAVGLDTVYDLASLTKVLATSGLVLLAVQRGELDLDQPVAQRLPAFGGAGRERVTLADLLAHTSGLAAWRGYHAELAGFAGGRLMASLAGRDEIRAMVAAERLEARPGERTLYSDLGFILLDWLLEVACGQRLGELFDARIAGPLDLADLFFIDLTEPGCAARARQGRTFAATERCPWRARVLVGEVHDNNAFAMGGVAGHAGLFGTAAAVGRLAAEWLACFKGRAGLFSTDLVRRFWTRRAERCLGFDVPTPGGSQAGTSMGPATVGHLGFTGTSVWIDPDRDLIAVLLTNRVHPSRDNDAIRSFRPRLHDTLIAHIDEEAA